MSENLKHAVTHAVTHANKVVVKSIKIEGGQLEYEVAGREDGPVVLCVPGMADTRREYERFTPALLEEGYRVITADLRGNGGSLGRFKSYTMQDLALDINRILDAEKVEKVYLAACSISCASAGLYAIQQPERVAGLILFSAVFSSGSPFVRYMMGGLLTVPVLGRAFWNGYFPKLYPLHPAEPDYLAANKANLRQPGAMRSLVRLILTKHLDGEISQIKVPTLIFLGSADPDFKDAGAEAQRVQGMIPQATIKILEGVGHYPQREVPEQVIPVVTDWLKAL